MKCIINILILTLTFFASGCHEKGEEPAPSRTAPENSSEIWTKGFPLAYAGTHTFKLAVSLKEPGSIYYILSEKSLDKLDNKGIKDLAFQISQGKVEDMIGGVVSINAGKIKDTIFIEHKISFQSRNCFSYFFAERKKKDTMRVESEKNVVQRVNFLPLREKETSYFSKVKGKNINYLFYALEDYYLNPSIKYPLLIFLHGKGEYGNGNKLNFYKNGIIPQLIHEGKDFPFIIASPQIDSGRWDTNFVDEFITYIIEKYKVDENRIYMTGNSLGGVGTWEYAGDYPDRLAAIVPISGEGDTLEACKLKDIPIWAFHDKEDGIMDVRGSIAMVEAIGQCEPKGRFSPKLTIYPTKGHNAWIRTYDGTAGNDIFSWMLSYHKE